MILRLSLLGFLFGLAFRVLAVDPDPVDGADVEQIRTDVHAIRSSASALEGIGQSAVLGLSQLHDDQIGLYQFLDEYLSESGPEGSIGYEFSAMSQLLKQFLTGSVGDPWSSVYPQFRFLSGPAGRLNPANTGTQQSLTYFLNFVLGQNIDYRPGDSARSRWEDLFTTNSVFRGVTSETSTEKIGYSAFNIWLAEAMRRQLTNQLDFAARGGSWSNEESGAPSSTEEGNNLATNVAPSGSVDVDRPASVGWFDSSVVDSPDWSLEGANLDPTVFDATVGGQRMVLKVPFSAGGGAWRLITSFMVYVATACVLVGIIRSEIDYWTTLGGSAT